MKGDIDPRKSFVIVTEDRHLGVKILHGGGEALSAVIFDDLIFLLIVITSKNNLIYINAREPLRDRFLGMMPWLISV